MKDCGGHFHGKYLKQSLEYVMNLEKTQNGRLIGGVNCQPESAFSQMMNTKQQFGKVDKRQGYHLILSFKEGEVNPDTAFEIAEKFVKLLREKYDIIENDFKMNTNASNKSEVLVRFSYSYDTEATKKDKTLRND